MSSELHSRLTLSESLLVLLRFCSFLFLFNSHYFIQSMNTSLFKTLLLHCISCMSLWLPELCRDVPKGMIAKCSCTFYQNSSIWYPSELNGGFVTSFKLWKAFFISGLWLSLEWVWVWRQIRLVNKDRIMNRISFCRQEQVRYHPDPFLPQNQRRTVDNPLQGDLCHASGKGKERMGGCICLWESVIRLYLQG